MLHTASIEQLRAANLPTLLRNEVNSQPDYCKIPKEAMKALEMQLRFMETDLNESKGVLKASLILSWNQDNGGNFCSYNKEAEKLGLQKAVWLRSNGAEIPLTCFTQEQIELFKARQNSVYYQEALSKAKDKTNEEKFPLNRSVWGFCDLKFIFTSGSTTGSTSNGLNFALMSNMDFSNAELNGLNGGRPLIDAATAQYNEAASPFANPANWVVKQNAVQPGQVAPTPAMPSYSAPPSGFVPPSVPVYTPAPVPAPIVQQNQGVAPVLVAHSPAAIPAPANLTPTPTNVSVPAGSYI